MPRVKRGTLHSKRRKSLLKRVKGFSLGRKKLIKLAQTADTKAGAHAYRDRRLKKRNTRRMWQVQINAALRAIGSKYSTFIGATKTKNIELDRKVLSELAKSHPTVFEKVVDATK